MANTEHPVRELASSRLPLPHGSPATRLRTIADTIRAFATVPHPTLHVETAGRLVAEAVALGALSQYPEAASGVRVLSARHPTPGYRGCWMDTVIWMREARGNIPSGWAWSNTMPEDAVMVADAILAGAADATPTIAEVSRRDDRRAKTMRPCVAKAGQSLEAAIAARDELIPEAGKAPSKRAWEWVRDNVYVKGKCPGYKSWCRYIREYHEDDGAATKLPGRRVDLPRSATWARDTARR